MNLSRTERKETRNFGIALGTVLVIVATVQLLKHRPRVSLCLYVIGGIDLLLAFLAPAILKPVQWLLTRIARAIGWFNTRVLLGMVFYVCFAPLGMLMRLFGKDPLEKKMDRGAESYWIRKETPARDVSRYEKQF